MMCFKCNHHHTETEPHVCTLFDCKCDHTTFMSNEKETFDYHSNVIATMDNVTDKMKYLLLKVGGFRNLTNKQLVFAYWHFNHNFCPGMVLDMQTYAHLEDPEVITRIRRKVVEDNPLLGPTDAKYIKEKGIKQMAIMEWCIENKGGSA